MRIFRFEVILPALAAALLAGCHRDTPPPREFDGPGSFRYIETQVGFGPRIPGTEAHRRMAAWLDSRDALPGRDGSYVVSQGREVGHDARLSQHVDAEGDVWSGGQVQTVIQGTITW